jgi:tRNA(Ile)-lysidine synthase
MSFTLEALRNELLERVPSTASGLLIAFSGGVDSTVLLHAAAALRSTLPWPLRAVHINHQLHSDARAWAAHCRSVAAGLDIAFEHLDVTLAHTARDGIEAAARSARYEALRTHLLAGEALLTAHQADDQAETLLLALMRGTGVRGLGGMPACRRFGSGWHVRPLLPFRRAALVAWAQANALTWIDDPANVSARFSRNFLRTDILPRLEARWPNAVEHMHRAAMHAAESADLLDDLAQIDAADCAVGTALNLAPLQTLSDARQRNLLRWWLRERGARAPSAAVLADLRTSVIATDFDRVPHIDIDGVRVLRHRRLLYAERIDALFTIPTPQRWHWREPFLLPPGGGALHMQASSDGGLARARLPETVEVRFRVGGEQVRLPSKGFHRTLKNLLQEAGVLPWWRGRIPLLYIGDQLCAVADFWIAADMQARPGEAAVKVVWQDRPNIFAQG